MTDAAPRAGQRVVAVTGGGGGIGAAIAEELGRQGAFVLTIDPLVTLDGTASLPAPEETTAARIVAAGGSARASSASVTDRDAIAARFEELGRLDGVVNVAGISRPTGFATGTEEDRRAVLSVHLDGYLNVLAAALPIMAAAGHGRILGVTSGSGWRAADTGAYGCAKRAVASLTWQLGRHAPPGVVVNAMSPIAVTRMVTAALGRARPGGTGPPSAATGGLSLGAMPEPEELAAFGAHLVGDDLAWCRGRVLFAGGSEVAVIDEPRLLEVLGTDEVPSLAHALETFGAGALAPAEVQQGTGGAGNPRFTEVFVEPAASLPPPASGSCLIVSDRPELALAVTSALEARGVGCATAAPGVPGVRGAADVLASGTDRRGPLDAVVVALAGTGATGSEDGWEALLADHAGLVEQLHADASWARAVADHATASDRPMRLVTLTDATTAGGRSRAQSAVQLARAGRGATGGRVAAFAVSVEGRDPVPVGELVAHLVGSLDATALAGAELVVADGWLGLRSHPRPGGSLTFGGPELPTWFDGALRQLVGEADR